MADPNFESPTTHQWGFSIQREICKNTVVEVNYIGRRAHNLFGAYNANQAEFRNGFLDAFKVVNGGGESPLINQLMSVDSRKTARETGSPALRRVYTTDLRTTQSAPSHRIFRAAPCSGKGQPEAAGLGPYFFLAYPQFATALNVIDSNDWSTYHALRDADRAAYVERAELAVQLHVVEVARHAQLRSGAHTISHGQFAGRGKHPFDIGNRRLNYGLSDFDRTPRGADLLAVRTAVRAEP